MTLCRGHVSDLTVAVFVVVPGNEASHPAPSMIKIPKPLCWIFWPILTGTKQRFRISIIVGDPCSTVRWGHTGVFQGSWNMTYATSNGLRSSMTSVDFSGLSQTLPTGCQLRVFPDQRAGLSRLACW